MVMRSGPSRIVVDAAALLGVAWLWIAIYESFTRSGLWRVVDEAFGAVQTLPGQAAVLAACILVGWILIVGAAVLAGGLFAMRARRGNPR